MKRILIVFLLGALLTGSFVSCKTSQGNEKSEDTSMILSSDVDVSNVSLEDSASKSDNSTSWEAPEDVENPSQGLELAESYSKEYGDCYVVAGIGTYTDEDLVIPSTVDGLPVVEIADRAFENNTKIKSVYCGNRVTKIGKFAFRYCKNLKEIVIPDSVEKICEEAFAVSGVEDVTMSDRIAAMERAVFTRCESLKNIKLPLSLTIIPDQAFAGCSSLANVELSPNTAGISYRAFVKTALKTITLPASVESIEPTAFVELPLQSYDVNEDNPYFCSVDGVLYSKDKSTLEAYPLMRGNYTVPDGVIMIDNGAFYTVDNGTCVVNLPESIRTISERAFFTPRKNLTLNVKKGLSFIDVFAFSCMDGALTINFEGTKEEWNAISKADYWYAPYLGLGDQTIRVNCTDGALTFEYKMQ